MAIDRPPSLPFLAYGTITLTSSLGAISRLLLLVDVCWTLVAEEPHRSTISNLGHCPLKANVRCLIFPLQQGKMSSVQPLSGLDSPSQGSRGQLTNMPPYHNSPSLSPFTIGKATRAHPALATFSLYLAAICRSLVGIRG
jgi:hypothetical protein